MNLFQEVLNYRLLDNNILNILFISFILSFSVPIDIVFFIFDTICYSFLCFIIIKISEFISYIVNFFRNITSNSNQVLSENIHPHPNNMLRRNSLNEIRRQMDNRVNVNNLSRDEIDQVEENLFSERRNYTRIRNKKSKREIQRNYIMSLPTCSKNGGDCPYCLDDMSANDCVIGICGHKYHKGCVVQHFNYCFQNDQLFCCPVCRSDWC